MIVMGYVEIAFLVINKRTKTTNSSLILNWYLFIKSQFFYRSVLFQKLEIILGLNLSMLINKGKYTLLICDLVNLQVTYS
jgi:hypothetical protein